MTSKLLLLAISLCGVVLTTAPLQAQAFTDDFADNVMDPAKWNDTLVEGNGRLMEQNSRVEYVVSTPDGDFDQAVRTWTMPLPVDKDWEATLLTGIAVTPTEGFPNVSIGLAFHHPSDFKNFHIYVEQYTERQSSIGQPFRGFLSSMSGDSDDDEGLTGDLGVIQGAVQLAYSAATKVITASYDRDAAAGAFSWQFLASYGLAGSGGITHNANWDFAAGGFRLCVEAFSERLAIDSNSVWADDFKLTIFENAPPLDFRRVNNSLVIAWSAEAGDRFSLYSRASLSDGAWVRVQQQPSRVGDTFEVSVPIGESNQFFQLIE